MSICYFIQRTAWLSQYCLTIVHSWHSSYPPFLHLAFSLPYSPPFSFISPKGGCLYSLSEEYFQFSPWQMPFWATTPLCMALFQFCSASHRLSLDINFHSNYIYNYGSTYHKEKKSP